MSCRGICKGDWVLMLLIGTPSRLAHAQVDTAPSDLVSMVGEVGAAWRYPLQHSHWNLDVGPVVVIWPAGVVGLSGPQVRQAVLAMRTVAMAEAN